ncbi:MAG TPA: autotransporter outer membrane beta-barrel domain-containing protein [Thiopseudomonas sp.]|nr:autotransporter outer membrane beta-barrel domain-containing protein [Thiopseudomonas sp.]
MKKSHVFICALSLALPVYSAQAIEYRTVYTSTGLPAFELRFFDVGDGPFIGDAETSYLSTWNLSNKNKDDIATAAKKWTDILQPKEGQLPGIINIGTFDALNAAGDSGMNYGEGDLFTESHLLAAMQGHAIKNDLHFDSHGQMIIGTFDFDTAESIPSQVPNSSKLSLINVAFHELAHSLGVLTFIADMDDNVTPKFAGALTSWEQLLFDDNGNPAKQDQTVLCSECVNPYNPAAFDLRKDQAYLSGKNIDEVLAGGLRGVPVKILTEYGTIDTDYMSHSELKNSLMSHQGYRNYTTFMEVELAIMQDMGYEIDRRDFFGHSVYGSGLTMTNTQGFSKRNAEGTAYVPGQYSTTALGLGLHVYGSNNTIYQQADLLTKGDGGAGVRVDGEGNTLVIDPGTRIYADGWNNRGILFAYGKDQNLIQRGDVQALGKDGIAVDFDFGYNLLSDDSDYRGSYIHSYTDSPLPQLDELNGALVHQFDLTGRVAGTKAAIHLSKNALVNQINVMQGAKIEGHILSEYAQRDENDQLRFTTLSFGKQADDTGRATTQADHAFQLRYDGNIEGDNLTLVMQGGSSALNGQHQLYDVRVANAATLQGNAKYTLNETRAFINEGTIAPGNNGLGRIDINGNYQQTSSAVLLMDVNGHGQHDVLAVHGNAALNGSLILALQPDWYAQDWRMRSDTLLQTLSLSGDFATIGSAAISPTLSFSSTVLGAGIHQLSVFREANAYSQYARNGNESAVGTALYTLATQAGTDIQPLYRALDFSSVDGSHISSGLAQIAPSAYSAMIASSLIRERQLANVINTRLTLATDADWQGFALPFGEHTSQESRNTVVGYKNTNYGVVVGAQRAGFANDDLTIGLYGAFSQQSISLKEPFNGKGESTTLHLGTQLRLVPNEKAGMYAFASAHLGLEDSTLERKVRLPGYAANTTSDWTALSGTVMAGSGYKWRISEAVSAGPVAQLSYTTFSHSHLTESGDVTALNIRADRFHMLRSSLGVNTSIEYQTSTAKKLKGELQATWDRELLNDDFEQRASFKNYPSATFTSRNKITGRNALDLRAGLSYEVNNSLSIGGSVATSLFQSGYKSLAGNASVQWRF